MPFLWDQFGGCPETAQAAFTGQYRRPCTQLKRAIREALNKLGRTEEVRKIAERFGVDPGTVQRISRPFAGASVAAA